jgi:hypothetical protein
MAIQKKKRNATEDGQTLQNLAKSVQAKEDEQELTPSATPPEGISLDTQATEQDTTDTGSQAVVKDEGSIIYGRDDETGRKGAIGEMEIKSALDILTEYKTAKKRIENKIIENEQWWRRRHWDTVPVIEGKEDDEEPTSAWLFNSLANKHADFMDNIPTPNFLPREESDEEEAKLLQKIVPCIFDINSFESLYSDCSWTKMKQGTAIYGVFWNSHKENGLGDIDIKEIDLKNVYWEGGIKDIQASPHFFSLARVDIKTLESTYPFLEGRLHGGEDTEFKDYMQDEHDNDRTEAERNRTTVVDWYYKKINDEGKSVVHYVKFVEGEVIYASENDEEYMDRGYYDHGLYPFVFDVLFPVASSPIGFGFIDIMKSPQLYIDKIDQLILKNASLSGKKRWFVKENSVINEDEYADWSKDFVHVSSGQLEDNLKEIQVSGVPPFIVNHLQQKIQELKETSGNRDFSQGSTQSGVTAASAIAALQEAGSKLSRDMIKTTYRSYTAISQIVVELIRQFYTEERAFRIDKPNGGYKFVRYNNSNISEHEEIDPLTSGVIVRRPIFDIKISAQKQSPFNRTAQNEMAKELFNLGCFNPQLSTQVLPMLEMMDFEGIEKIRETVSQNGTMSDMLTQLQPIIMQMARQIDSMSGGMTNYMAQVTPMLAQATGQNPQQLMAMSAQPQMPMQGLGGMDSMSGASNEPTGQMGNKNIHKITADKPKTDNSLATQARIRASKVGNVDYK